MWHLRRIWEVADRTRRPSRSTNEIYEEPAFRHFLGLERRRAERRGQSLLLLLVEITSSTDHHAATAHERPVFQVLETCVRETDFLGWYQTARIAGAVLLQGDTAPTPAFCRAMGNRVTALLKARLPGDVATEVRVLQLAAKREEQHA